MNDVIKQFRMVIPAELSKGKDGDWIVQGLASTSSRDQQGEVILPNGIDATPIDEGRGILNWDHQKGPENIVGLLDSYTKTEKGFFVKGRLLKNHQKAKSIHEIMSSLGKSDHGRMGLSVEGKILERAGKDGKIIKKCQISAVALTMNPVNQDSFVDLVKSMQAGEVEFQATEENSKASTEAAKAPEPTFTTEQVAALLKSLGIGSGVTAAPGSRTGGDALQPEALDKKPKIAEVNEEKPKRLKKMSKALYKSQMVEILDKLTKLYPSNSKAEIWSAVKDRLEKKFPGIGELS